MPGEIGIPFGEPDQVAPQIPIGPHPRITAPPKPPAPVPPPAPAPTPAPAPEPEPTLGEAWPELGKLSWLIVLLGLIALASALVDVLNTFLRWVLGPLYARTGRRQATPEQFTQWLTDPLGRSFQGLDADIGQSFNKLGQLTTRTGGAILAGQQVSYQIAVKLSRVQQHGSTTDKQVAHTRQQAQAAQAAAQEAAQTAEQTAKRTATTEHALHQQVQGLTHHITHVIEPELDALRHKIPQLERGATTAWDEIKKHDEALGLGALTAATALGLSRLGAGWTRCETNQRIGRFLCGSPPDLVRSLLSGLIDALVLTDICDLADLAARAAEAARPTMIAFVDVEDALVGCHGTSKAAPIRLARVSATPVFAAITL